jgi:hypothetical protein
MGTFRSKFEQLIHTKRLKETVSGLVGSVGCGLLHVHVVSLVVLAWN